MSISGSLNLLLHLSFHAYHVPGSQQERLYLRDDLLSNRDYQVLVTTYNMATGNKDDRSFLRKLRCKVNAENVL